MNSSKNQIAPIKHDDRIEFLDVLRGIAIQFIFMANIVYFSGYFFFPQDFRNPEYVFTLDKALDFISFALIDGKFYSIFSLLFGIGCIIQYEKSTKNNKPFAPFFISRMFWLLIFGGFHLVGFWLGDILTLYAILGFVLILFVKTPDKKLLWIAGVLILLPLLNWFVINTLNLNYTKPFFKASTYIWEYFGYPTTEWNGKKFIQFKYYLLNDDWTGFFKMNLGNVFVRIGNLLDEGRIFKVLGVFLIGLWAGRNILRNQLLKNIKLLKKITLFGILIGLPMSILRTYIEFFGDNSNLNSFLKTLTYALGTVPLALGYASLLALIYANKPNLLNRIAPVGKMAFTNYISQTIISILLFYKVGFGFVGQFGFTVIITIALIIFLCQVILSTMWLRKFRYGPLEWIWRQFTYKRRLPLLKNSTF